ncbi:Uncharacterized protein APZ42_005624, partial [Daphnia magna]
TSRSKDHTRPNQFQFACDCPFNFKIVFNPVEEKFCIQKTGFNITHGNHSISAEHIQLYHRMRNLNDDESEFIDTAVKMDVLPGKIASELKLKYNKYVTSKDIENRRQQVQGLSTSEWGATSEKFELLCAGGSIIHVDTDNEGEINLIYIQLQEQVELFSKYPEVIQLDGTHRTNKLGMPLYTIMIKDNYGLGQPACFFFVREETTARIKAGLTYFSKDNDVRKTEVFITDKDCAEIGAAKEIFVNAKHKLCYFHAFRAVDIRLRKANLELNHRKEIYDSFHRAVYAKSQEELELEEDYLVTIEDYELGGYFDSNWINIKE